MAITKADVVAIAPELSGVDEDTVNVFIADAALLEPSSSWDSGLYPLVHKYLTAHLLTVAGHAPAASAQGPISSMSVGGVSVSYAVQSVQTGTSGLGATKYGLVVQTLRRQRALHVAVVG